MLVRCRRKRKKIFADESLKPFRKVFCKPRRLGFSGSFGVR